MHQNFGPTNHQEVSICLNHETSYIITEGFIKVQSKTVYPKDKGKIILNKKVISIGGGSVVENRITDDIILRKLKPNSVIESPHAVIHYQHMFGKWQENTIAFLFCLYQLYLCHPKWNGSRIRYVFPVNVLKQIQQFIQRRPNFPYIVDRSSFKSTTLIKLRNVEEHINYSNPNKLVNFDNIRISTQVVIEVSIICPLYQYLNIDPNPPYQEGEMFVTQQYLNMINSKHRESQRLVEHILQLCEEPSIYYSMSYEDQLMIEQQLRVELRTNVLMLNVIRGQQYIKSPTLFLFHFQSQGQRKTVHLGRNSDDIQILDGSISRDQGRLEIHQNDWYYFDGTTQRESTNGSFKYLKKNQEYELHNNDTIIIEDNELKFTINESRSLGRRQKSEYMSTFEFCKQILNRDKYPNQKQPNQTHAIKQIDKGQQDMTQSFSLQNKKERAY